MTSSATSRLRLNFHHIKVDFKKSEVVQPLVRAGRTCAFKLFCSNQFFHMVATLSRNTVSQQKIKLKRTEQQQQNSGDCNNKQMVALTNACEREGMRQLSFGLKEFKNICYWS